MEYTKSMRVCFVTEQKSVCRVIINRLNDFGYHGYIQDDWLGLDNDLHSTTKKVDLLVCDFSYAGNASINFFEIVKQTGNNVPVIFYNDPLPDDDERVAWWIMQNENAYNTILPENTIELLNRLNSLICDSKIRPHISLLQPPVPLAYKDLRQNTPYRELDLYQFRRRTGIPPSMFSLFQYMYKNRTRDFTLMELSKALFKKRGRARESINSVYSYISRLKKYIEKDTESRIDIIRTSMGRYEMIVY